MLKDKFDITIAILNYNRERFIDRAIRSCLDQVLFNKTMEIIILDDCSNDNSYNKILEYKISKNIKILKNKKNYGIGFSSQKCLKNSRGKYFMRVDSDDFLNKYAANDLSRLLDHNKEFSFVCSDHFRVNEDGKKQKLVKLNTLNKIKNHGAGILFRKNDILSVGGFNSNLKEAEDYELITKLIKKNKKYFYLPIPYYRYFIHETNISHSGKRNKIISQINKN
tara:strand:+ start:3400 stop:4068 length:669 start_codon:yes stop_codon:yes gene_type:complete